MRLRHIMTVLQPGSTIQNSVTREPHSSRVTLCVQRQAAAVRMLLGFFRLGPYRSGRRASSSTGFHNIFRLSVPGTSNPRRKTATMVERRLVSELQNRQSDIRFLPKAIRKYEDEPKVFRRTSPLPRRRA